MAERITLHPKQLAIAAHILNGLNVMVSCGRKFGKALSLDTEIPTPDRGFVLLRDIKEGDLVFGEDGLPTRVKTLFDINYSSEMYRVGFSDGSFIDTCKDHQWLTTTKVVRKSQKRNFGGCPIRYPKKEPEVVTTIEILKTLRAGKEWNHSVQVTNSIQVTEKIYSIDPYLMGVWLGDGNSAGGRITGIDEEIFESIAKLGFVVTQNKKAFNCGVLGLTSLLRREGVLGNKHVPVNYLWGSASQRLSLLQGLMDTDGTISKTGHCCFDNTNKNLADAVCHLLSSLGEQFKRAYRIPRCYGKEGAPCYRVHFAPQNIIPFRLSRKIKRLKVRGKPNHRFIISVNPILSIPSRCLQVDNSSHLFLVGRNFIPTHNSTDIQYAASRKAATFEKAYVYVILPTKKQAKEIYWEQQIITDICNPKVITSARGGDEMRISFVTGSFVKFDGSDSPEILRGPGSHLFFLDEIKDIKRKSLTAMEPNLLATGGNWAGFGTPPDNEDDDGAKFWFELIERFSTDENSKLFYGDSEENPHIDRMKLLAIEKQLRAAGKYDEYEREYKGIYRRGSDKLIFADFNQALHVRPDLELRNLLGLAA